MYLTTLQSEQDKTRVEPKAHLDPWVTLHFCHLYCPSLPALLLNSTHACIRPIFIECLLCARNGVLETVDINPVVGLAHAKSLWQKRAWPVRGAEQVITWLEQKACQRHAGRGGCAAGKGRPAPRAVGRAVLQRVREAVALWATVPNSVPFSNMLSD